jgi:CheY-like chemotaxis protein
MKTIVIIDDNPSDREVVKIALAEASIAANILCFSDGEQGVFFARENRPELCPVCLFILDINLPRSSGHEVLKAIRSGPYQDVPVIVMTSSRRPQDCDEELLQNAHYFRKPLDLEEFLSIGALAARVMLDAPARNSAACSPST